MNINNNDKNVNTNSQLNIKFEMLNSNLKLEIFKYLPIVESYNTLLSCNKSFKKPLKKDKNSSFNKRHKRIIIIVMAFK